MAVPPEEMQTCQPQTSGLLWYWFEPVDTVQLCHHLFVLWCDPKKLGTEPNSSQWWSEDKIMSRQHFLQIWLMSLNFIWCNSRRALSQCTEPFGILRLQMHSEIVSLYIILYTGKMIFQFNMRLFRVFFKYSNSSDVN